MLENNFEDKFGLFRDLEWENQESEGRINVSIPESIEESLRKYSKEIGTESVEETIHLLLTNYLRARGNMTEVRIISSDHSYPPFD